MDSDHGSPAVACSLGRGDLDQRVARWKALTAGALAEAMPTDRGMRLVFDAGPGVAEELRILADSERECCAFAAWSVRPGGRQIVLEVTGDSQEAVTAIQAMSLAHTGESDSPPA